MEYSTPLYSIGHNDVREAQPLSRHKAPSDRPRKFTSVLNELELWGFGPCPSRAAAALTGAWYRISEISETLAAHASRRSRRSATGLEGWAAIPICDSRYYAARLRSPLASRIAARSASRAFRKIWPSSGLKRWVAAKKRYPPSVRTTIPAAFEETSMM